MDHLRPMMARARRRTRSVVGRHPTLYLALARLRGKPAVGRGTEIVIEGYPRSANTFAATAFGFAQLPRRVTMARHLHAPAQVITAVKAGIPTIVLVRDPDDAVLSHVLWLPHLTVKQAMKEYADFYEGVLPHRNRFVTARFEEVTTDYGRVIRQLNERFGSSFEEFQHTEENVAEVFAILENYEMKTKGYVSERISRPSEERAVSKEELRSELEDPALAQTRERAYRAYEALVGVDSRA